MDNAVKRYKVRRQERINGKNGVKPRFDSVEEFKKRREGRLRERMDAGIGWVFGALKSNGVDTKGMSVDDAFEAWNKLNGGDGSKGGKENEKKGVGAKKEPTKSLSKERSEFASKFKSGTPITGDTKLKKGDVITDGEQTFVIGSVGSRRVSVKGLTKSDKTIDGSEVSTGGLVSPRHFGEFRVVGSFEGKTEDEMEQDQKYKGLTERGKQKGVSGESHGSRYVREFKTSGGVDYPKPKNGAMYDEDTLKEVNRLADEAAGKNQPNKTKQQGEVLNKLTEKDLVYQKDPNGVVVASIPGLSQMWDKRVVGKGPEVQAAYDKRIEGGKKIGADMIAISDKLGSRMMGLENMFKGGGSTARKIDKVKKKFEGENLTDEEALGLMDDVVRFSFKCDHDKMVDQIKGLESELKKSGYEITERDNKFLPDPKGKPRNYKAVHLQVKAPNGELFEVQVQSEETIKAKNKNHRYFEKQRTIDLKEHPEMQNEYDRLEKIMVENVNEMSEPPGIADLPTFKRKK